MTSTDPAAGPAPSERRAAASICLQPDLALIPLARLVARAILPTLTVDDEPLYYGAVTELIANAIEAHQRDGVTEAVLVEVFTDRPALVRVTDAAEGFDPTSPAVDGNGGLGLRIASAVSPDLAITSEPTGTTVDLPIPEELLE